MLFGQIKCQFCTVAENSDVIIPLALVDHLYDKRTTVDLIFELKISAFITDDSAFAVLIGLNAQIVLMRCYEDMFEIDVHRIGMLFILFG